MGRVTTRQVVEFLDPMCPGLANWSVEQSRAAQLSFGFDSQLSAVVQLIDEVPAELMPSDADRYAELVTSASLRQDVSWASSALRNGEWKAATVLAGSVVEAMLFWELQQHPADAVSSDLDRRYLPEYIAAAEKLRCLRGDTIIAARLAQNYRNLIHQGRSIRLGDACDRGTAHVSIGALDHVVRDFENKECPRHRSN